MLMNTSLSSMLFQRNCQHLSYNYKILQKNLCRFLLEVATVSGSNAPADAVTVNFFSEVLLTHNHCWLACHLATHVDKLAGHHWSTVPRVRSFSFFHLSLLEGGRAPGVVVL